MNVYDSVIKGTQPNRFILIEGELKLLKKSKHFMKHVKFDVGG